MKKILCIVDSYQWALANRARALKKYFPEHKFEIKHFQDLTDIQFNNYDIIYSLNWPIHGYIQSKISSKRSYRLITSISSHIGQPSDKIFFSILKQYDAVSLSNKFLYNQFLKKFKNIPLFYTPFGVDHELFVAKTDPAKYQDTFGWVGNKNRDVKRFKEIELAIAELKLSQLKFKIATQESNLSREEMVEFYNSIGTLICFSLSEGTPNPILEAAACGRSIISTRVGNVPELTKNINSVQIVDNKEQLKKAILRNFNNSQIIKIEGQLLRKEIDIYWNWKSRSQDFKQFLGV